MKAFIIGALCAIAILPPRARAAVTLTPETTLFISEEEPGPIQLAARDLEHDWLKVFGHPLRVVHNPREAGATSLWIALDHDVPGGVPKLSGWEKLHIQAVSNPWPGSPIHSAVVLSGSDVRGTIYAIYQFSQQFLGVDPLYWWTDHAPAHRASVIVPANFSETQAPAFRYRGFFINDEDLLTGWKPGVRDGADISLKIWNRIFEAILRLKGNMVIPGTWIFPYEPQIKLAEERGLIVSQHHVNVLGLDTYQWPENVPYSFISHPKIFESALKQSVEEYPKGAQVVWSVGYRGQNDYPFWMVDKSAPRTPAGRAQVIQEAIAKEIEILKQLHPHAHIVLNAWDETAGFIRQGLLKVPPGVALLWPDDGHGTLQDGGEISAGEGEYYHTAMIDYRSNHMSELVPLERIRAELGRAARAGATYYLIVNTSNLRPVLMTSRATMELAWNPKPWTQDTPDETSVYLNHWCREEFGAKAAGAVARYYHAYFAAPAKYAPPADARMGDQFYEIFSRFILMQLSKGTENQPLQAFGIPSRIKLTPAQMAAHIAEECAQADPRWELALHRAEQARPLVPAARKLFFQSSVLTQVEINLHGNDMMEDVAEAAQTNSVARREQLVQSSIAECQAIERALLEADYGKWKGFYTRGDWLEDVPLTLALERAYLRQLQGHAMDLNTMIRAEDGGFAYHMITAYQGTQHVRF